MSDHVPYTMRELNAFWRRHQTALAAVPRELYDTLDGLIRSDERRRMLALARHGNIASHYDALVGENATLTRQLQSRHVLGTCPHCARGARPEVVPMAAIALVLALSGAAVASLVAVLIHAGYAAWWR